VPLVWTLETGVCGEHARAPHATVTVCLISLQEFLRSNISSVVPEPIASFHDDLLRRYSTTGMGTVINEQRVVFGVKRTGYVFPMALFVRGGTEGTSVVGVIQAVVARDDFILCTGADYTVIGVSEGSARAFGITAGDFGALCDAVCAALCVYLCGSARYATVCSVGRLPRHTQPVRRESPDEAC
jgi:hypothetical protein